MKETDFNTVLTSTKMPPSQCTLHPSSFILARDTVFAVKILSVFLTSARGRPLQGLITD